MLHWIASNQWSCSSQSGFTMHSDGSWLFLDDFQKLINNIGWRRGSIWKDQIMMFDTLFGESIGIISMIVKPDDHGDSKLLKDRHVIGRSKHAVLKLWKKYSIFIDRFVVGWAEGDKLVGYNPVEIAVLNFFIMFILVEVEFSMIEPFEF